MTYSPERPDEKLQYSFDWSSWLDSGSPAETISSRIWTVSPTGPTLTNETTETVTIEGVEFGKLYRLQEEITTSQGRIGVMAVTIRGVL